MIEYRSLAAKIHIRDVILFSLALHLLAIGFPSDGGKIFDENFYVPAANDLLNGHPSNPEHPFLGKLWGSIGIAIFGNNWFGWRIPMVAFGMLTLYVFYHLAKIFLDERKALLATAFLSFDTIFFIHSSILLLEIPALFFGILGFYLYLKDRYMLSAASFALALLSKEWSVLFLIALLAYHLMVKKPWSRKDVKVPRRIAVQTAKFIGVLIVVVFVPLWIYASAYQPPTSAEVQVKVTQFVDQQGNIVRNSTSTTTVSKGQILNPIEQLKYIVTYQSKLTIKPDSKITFWNNYAWGWIIPYDSDPPLYYQNTVRKESVTKAGEVIIKKEVTEKHPVNWRGTGNFPIWLAIWPIIPFAIINIIRKKPPNKLDLLIIAWIIGTYLPWFYVSGVMGRIVYAFYFINVVPILALAIPYFIGTISKGSIKAEWIIASIWFAAAVIFFFAYYPVGVFDYG
ncbi:MAG: glycosyltransferase family 39 protein [Nitrososphaerales archaeon]